MQWRAIGQLCDLSFSTLYGEHDLLWGARTKR
jgi:hypothetical protein